MADDPDALPPEYLAEPDRYFMEWIPRVLADKPAIVARAGSVSEVAQIELAGERGGTWHFVLGDGRVLIERGAHERPSFVIAMAVDTWRSLREGRMGVAGAVIRRKVRHRGSLRALLRVAKLFDAKREKA